MASRRPNRSDVHLPLEVEAKIEEETREYFDGLAPKRHTKPERSDYSSQYSDALPNSDSDIIPEFVKFQHLENDDPQKLVYNGNKVVEEYVETEYYKDLCCVDKQHHTTGTGFIKVENTNGNCFSLANDTDSTSSCQSCKGNPATNDWIPAAPDTINMSSDKPGRSDI